MMFEEKSVFVDVDDTLVRSVGSKIIPLPKVIDKVRLLAARGYRIFVWSSGGATYSERISKDLGIAGIVSGYFCKPAFVIDDQPVENWPATRMIHPLNIDEID